jgi:hypothetical protein
MYMATQFQHTLTFNEIEAMRQQVLGVVSGIHTNKHRIMTQDYRQLNNHLQYVLTTLSNMSNILAVEKSDPYNSRQADYSKVSGLVGKKVVYNPDGSTRIIDNNNINTTGDGWENQFDEGLLMKPPCFQMPPQSMTNIQNIQLSSQRNLTHHL